jgi:hypothetical protein
MAQLAEAQARLNVCLREIIVFLEEANIQEHSAALLNTFIDKHLTIDFLNLAEGFGKCMAFLDHDALVEKLYRSYCVLIDGYVVERKIISKKIRIMKEDKKADPDVVIRLENLLSDVDNKKALAMTSCMRLRAMNTIRFAPFKNADFDFKTQHIANVHSQRGQVKTKK